MGCFSGKKTRNQVSDLRISNTQNPCRKSKSCSKRCCVDERNLQSLHLMKMLQLQNLLQKSSKFYTFSQARGYTAGVSQKAARHDTNTSHVAFHPWVWWNFLRKKPIGRHRITLRICVCLFTHGFLLLLRPPKWKIFDDNISPTSNLPWNTGWSGRDSQSENPLPRNFPENFASSRATSSSPSWCNFSRSATCHMKKWIPITKSSEQEGRNTVDRRNLLTKSPSDKYPNQR